MKEVHPHNQTNATTSAVMDTIWVKMNVTMEIFQHSMVAKMTVL